MAQLLQKGNIRGLILLHAGIPWIESAFKKHSHSVLPCYLTCYLRKSDILPRLGFQSLPHGVAKRQRCCLDGDGCRRTLCVYAVKLELTAVKYCVLAVVVPVSEYNNS